MPDPNFSSFTEALLSRGPAPDRADRMGLYAWLIGDWTMDCTVHKDDGTTHKGRGEIHFVWALDGRAIQDVWILPGIFYGTTLRVYDPPHRCLAHPVERSAQAALHPSDRPRRGRRHRADRQGRQRGTDALAFR